MSVPSLAAEASYWRGRNHARSHQWREAAEAYQAAVSRDDGHAEWHYRLGYARERVKQWKRAAAAYQAAVSRDDGHAEWFYRLGLARERVDQWHRAAEAYQAAVGLDDRHAAWFFRLGRARERSKQWHRAAQAYQEALNRDDRNALWFFRLGRVRERLEHWNRAAQAYQEAVGRDDRRAVWFFRLGRARERAKQWHRAAAAYQEALNRDDRNPAWHYRLGRARERAKQWPAAVQAYEAALERDPAATERDRQLVRGNYEGFWARRQLRRFLTEHLAEIRSAAAEHARASSAEPKVYVYWGQGATNAPAVVRRCIQEVYAQHPANQVVVLDDTLVLHHVTLPRYIRRLMQTDKTKFSDVLRLALLARNGGAWLDATCLVTANVLEQSAGLLDTGFLAPHYSRYGDARISSWFLASRPGDHVVSMMLEANYAYWRHHEVASDYYLFHHIFEELYYLDEQFRTQWDSTPRIDSREGHLVQTIMYQDYDREKLDEALGAAFVHKLTRKLRPRQLTPDSMLSHMVNHGPGPEDSPLTLGLAVR